MRGRTADSEAATPVACPQNGAKKVRRGWPAGGQRRTAEAKRIPLWILCFIFIPIWNMDSQFHRLYTNTDSAEETLVCLWARPPESASGGGGLGNDLASMLALARLLRSLFANGRGQK